MKTNQDREREKKWKYNIWNSWKTSWNLVQDVFRIIIYRILSFRFFFASFFLIRCVRLCALRLACEFAVEWQRKQIVQWLFLNELRTIFIIIFFCLVNFTMEMSLKQVSCLPIRCFSKQKKQKTVFENRPIEFHIWWRVEEAISEWKKQHLFTLANIHYAPSV